MAAFENDLWPGTVLDSDGRPFSREFCGIHNCASVAVRADGSRRCLLCETHDAMFSQPGFRPLPCHRDYEAWKRGGFMQWRAALREGDG
jgi:hypothetical protein